MPGSIDIWILGPMEVYRAGSPVAIPAGKQRGLLALLALRAGSVQSSDLLIDALWGEEPPETARNVTTTTTRTVAWSWDSGVTRLTM